MNTKKNEHGLKALSLAEQAKIQCIWNDRLMNPLAFVPKEDKKGLDPTVARKKNIQFGRFAAGYLKMIISRTTTAQDIRRRQEGGKKMVAVGYGFGDDSKYVRKVTQAGFQTWSIDVSSVPWLWATNNLKRQFEAIPQLNTYLNQKPQVWTFEIQSLLAEPEKIGLDLASVEIWYLSRLLNCLSTKSAKIVLQEIGRTTLGSVSNSSGRGAVVIINALSDQNPANITDTCCGTSIRRSKKMIIANLSHGAGCPVEARFERRYQYFGKLVTAMTVMAKQ